MKTDVYRLFHHDSHRKKMVTIEGASVCMQAWMIIAGVHEATFYRY